MASRDVRAPSAPTGGTNVERASPLTGGDLVTLATVDGADGTTPTTPTTTAGSGSHVGIDVALVAGAVGGSTVAQGDPNGGGADAWPVSVASLPLPTGAATQTTLAAILARLSPGTRVGSSALEKSHVISAAACSVRSVKATNNGAADTWLHVFDAASLPPNGTVPSRTPIPVEAGSVNGDVWQGGTTMGTGCVAALSSTLSTLTLITSNDAWFDAEIN